MNETPIDNDMTRIAIIAGSTRPIRKSLNVAEWVLANAQNRTDATFEIVDVDDHNLPLLNEPQAAAFGPDYEHDHTRAWSDRIASFDGFVFVTPEYYHSIPGALKNAIDYLYVEWHDKVAGIVGYGLDGGVRAGEHLRAILSELHMAHVQAQVSLSIFADFDDDQNIDPDPRHAKKLDEMLDQVIAWTNALAPLRSERSATGHSESDDKTRPSVDTGAHQSVADAAVAALVEELQTGIDSKDAEIYNRHFSDDILWGDPYGGTLQGYDELHDIHKMLLGDGKGGPSSRYEVVKVLAPTPDVIVAHVRRAALDTDGRHIEPKAGLGEAFSEMALYVLVKRDGTWWLAAGHNTPIRT